VKVAVADAANPRQLTKERAGPTLSGRPRVRRNFGFRWSRRIMPPELRELMRHADISTTMQYYVGQDAESTAAALWRVYERIGNTSGNIGPESASDRGSENDTSPCVTRACEVGAIVARLNHWSQIGGVFPPQSGSKRRNRMSFGLHDLRVACRETAHAARQQPVFFSPSKWIRLRLRRPSKSRSSSG